MERCPRCGTRADAVPVTHHVPPGSARRLREHLDVVRRELGLRTDGEALLAAARLAALDLNMRAGIGSADAGQTARTIRPRRIDVGEHEQEQEGAAPNEEAAAPAEGGEQEAPAEGGDAAESGAEAPAEGEQAAEGEQPAGDEGAEGEPEPTQE